MRDRIKELRRVKASELLANPKNWRKHPAAQKTAMRAVLDKIGFVTGVIARETEAGLEIIDGHLRADISQDELVPVLIVDLDGLEADKVLATFDPIGAMAQQDTAALAALIKALRESGDELPAAVFPDYLLEPILGADWSQDRTKTLTKAITFTPEQYEHVKLAIAALRKQEGYEDIPDGRCIELVAADYLAGVH
jgi:hypothetical protein